MDHQQKNGYGCECRDTDFSEGSFYSLFFGLNDKCLGAQTIAMAQAVTFVQDVCSRHFVNGFTILTGSGADRGESDRIEASIYIMAINASESTVMHVAQIFRKKFNQSEILIEKNRTQYVYFHD